METINSDAIKIFNVKKRDDEKFVVRIFKEINFDEELNSTTPDNDDERAYKIIIEKHK